MQIRRLENRFPRTSCVGYSDCILLKSSDGDRFVATMASTEGRSNAIHADLSIYWQDPGARYSAFSKVVSIGDTVIDDGLPADSVVCILV